MNVCTRPTDPETIATNALFIQFDSSLDQIYRFFDSNNYGFGYFCQLMSMTSNKISKERNYALSDALFAFRILKLSLLKEVARYVIFVMFANIKSQHRCW